MTEAILFAYDQTFQRSGLLPGREQLFGKLQDRGLQPVVSLEAERAFSNGWVSAEEITDWSTPLASQPLGLLALHDEIKVIVNRLDRSNNLDDLPPVVNENKTRQLGHHRERAYQEILEPLGIALPTVLVNTPEDIEAFIESHDAEEYAAKSQARNRGDVTRLTGKSDVVGLFSEFPEWFGTRILQPAVNNRIPFPAQVRAYSTADQERFESLSKSGYAKELRMYGFHGGGTTRVFPVARAIAEGAEEWFFPDPQSIPLSVHRAAAAVVDRVAQVSQAPAVHGIVDCVYGSYSADMDPGWKVTEMHLRTPYLLGYDKHAEVADTLHELFADMLQETARPQ